MHCYIFSSVFLQLSVLTITISSNLIGALTALFFTNHCVLSCNRTVTLANHMKYTQVNPTKPEVITITIATTTYHTKPGMFQNGRIC